MILFNFLKKGHWRKPQITLIYFLQAQIVHSQYIYLNWGISVSDSKFENRWRCH